MTHPLENYRLIANPNYIIQIEYRFYNDHFVKLEKDGLHVFKEPDNNRITVMGVDLEGNTFGDHIAFSSYFISQYNNLENESRLEIGKIILAHLQEDKQQVLIKAIVAELQVLQNAIKKLDLEPKHEVYKSILLDKVSLFSKTLNEIYLTPQGASIPKIQWLADTKVLTTLFYELWKGQEKGKNEPKLYPLIKADKQDIEALLINNFVDKDQKPLKSSTMSDYLNTSKPENRSKKGIRIELDY